MTTAKPSGTEDHAIVIPYRQLDPQTLRRLIQEFVSRDGADWHQAGGSLEEKEAQILRQLRDGRAKVVFDMQSQTANIVPND